jgi:capsular exopolysaccharide synthesis family protein
MSAAERFERARESEGFSSTLGVLRRRWALIVGVVAVCVLVLAVQHERAGKSYAATASVAFQSTTLPDAALQVSSSGSGEPLRDAATEGLIAHSPEVAEGVRRQLHISTSSEELLGQVAVESAPNADVLHFIATTKDPKYSAQLANAFAAQYIAFKAAAQVATIEAAQRQLQTQIAAQPVGSPDRLALEQSQQRLGGLRAVAGGGANIIGLASVPTAPTGTKLSTTIIIGILVGLAIAFSLIFLLESLDRRIKKIEEFEQEYRLPALAGVPQTAFSSTLAKDRVATLEPYRILRSALDFTSVTRQIDTLLVTSAVSGEGKTTVAVDLSHAIALTGRNTILVELDLRRPTFANHFELRSRDGLTSAIVGSESAAEPLVQPLADVPTLSVLPAGRIPPNPSELLGSPRLVEILGELASDGAFLVLDAPPLNPVADAQVLLNSSAIHAAIVVARVNRTTREEVRRAHAILSRHMVEPVGLVVTGLRDAARYGYEAYGANGPITRQGEHDLLPPDMHSSSPLRRPVR